MLLSPIRKKLTAKKLVKRYTVSDYNGLNPESETMNDWKALVKHTHETGFKVINDRVSNQTTDNHIWLTTDPWDIFQLMLRVAKGERPVFSLVRVKNCFDTLYAKNGLQPCFISHHDENSRNKADYATMPGVIYTPFAMYTRTKRAINYTIISFSWVKE